jgi:putative phosphoribosyl transferase
LPGIVVDDTNLRNRSSVYQSREDAGAYLAKALEQLQGKDAIVLAIPSGGVPVGLAISSHLKLPFDLLIIRKIPIPGNPESGFGAVSLEGDMVLNEPMVRMLGLAPEEIEELAGPVREELSARNRIFRESRPWPKIKGKIAILVDDGLASGYTMLAAARVVHRREPKQIIVAVPTASARTVNILAPEVNMIFCPNIRSGATFAVADAYRHWHDLTPSEVVSLLEAHGLLAQR